MSALGICKSGVARGDIFLNTTLWSKSHYPEDVEAALDDSLADLKTGYRDLFLIHYLATFERGSARFSARRCFGGYDRF